MRPACLFALCVRAAAAAAVAGVPAATASPQPSTEAAETTAAEASAVTLTLATTTAEAATDPSAGRLSGDAETSPANAIPTASAGPENFSLKQQRQVPESALEAPISAKSRKTRQPSRPRTIWRNFVRAITAAAAILLVLMYVRTQNSQERRSKEKDSEHYSQPRRKSEQEQEMLRGEQQVFLQQQLQGRLQETQGQQSAQDDQRVKHLHLKGHERFQQQTYPQLLQPQQLGGKQRQAAWFQAQQMQPQQALQQQGWQPELLQVKPQPLPPQELPNIRQQAQFPQFQQLQEHQRQLQKPGQQSQLQQLQLQQAQEQQEHLQEQQQQRDQREHAQQLHPCFSRGQVCLTAPSRYTKNQCATVIAVFYFILDSRSSARIFKCYRESQGFVVKPMGPSLLRSMQLHASSLITALHCVDDVLKSSGKSQFFQDVRITKAVPQFSSRNECTGTLTTWSFVSSLSRRR